MALKSTVREKAVPWATTSGSSAARSSSTSGEALVAGEQEHPVVAEVGQALEAAEGDGREEERAGVAQLPVAVEHGGRRRVERIEVERRLLEGQLHPRHQVGVVEVGLGAVTTVAAACRATSSPPATRKLSWGMLSKR